MRVSADAEPSTLAHMLMNSAGPLYLVDNGSLRSDSVRNLRRVADALSRRIAEPVVAASLLHSNRVPAEQLDGVAAMNLERRLRLDYAAGARHFRILPFFFGPTGALTAYLPQRLAFLREKLGPFTVGRGAFLYLGDDVAQDDLLAILADNIEQVMRAGRLDCPRVVLVDHGSPLAEVAAVRDRLALQLGQRMRGLVESVVPASMERRPGDAYAFNEPLLATVLRSQPWSEGPVVVAHLFLSPGRHAGPGGDIEQICQSAQLEHPRLRVYRTALVATHPQIVTVLENRYRLPFVSI